MKIEERWKNGLGNIKTIIYGRTFIILVGFLLQLVFLIEGYIVLRKYSFLFYVLFGIIGVLAFIYIFNQRSSPDMKLAWMVPIAMFPIFGAVFYTTILFQPGAKRLRGRLEKLSVQTEDAIAKNADVLQKLHQESPHMAQLGYYLLKQDNSPVFGHTSVKYYPLGDYQFPDMLEALKQAKRFIFLEFFIGGFSLYLQKHLQRSQHILARQTSPQQLPVHVPLPVLTLSYTGRERSPLDILSGETDLLEIILSNLSRLFLYFWLPGSRLMHISNCFLDSINQLFL